MSQKKLSAVISIGGVVASSLKSAIGTTTSSFNKVGAAISEVTKRQRELNAVIAQQERLGAAGSAMKVQLAQKELATLDKKIGKLRTIQSLEAKGAALATKRAEIGGALRGSVATAGAAALPVGAAMMKSAQFGLNSARIGVTGDMSQPQIAGMNAEILAASKATNQFATDMQAGLGFLVASGLTMDKARTQLTLLGKTATATGAEMADVSKTTFTMVDTLKVGLGDTQKVLDTLLVTSKEGNVEFKDMARAVPALGASFASLGMFGREAAASMGAALQIARKGTDTADKAATNMENFLAKIQSPETLKKAGKEWGVDFSEVVAKSIKAGQNPLDAVLEVIKAKSGGSQKEIGEIFGDMQVQAFLRPMMQNFDEYKRIRDRAMGADGVIETDFQKIVREDYQAMLAVGQAMQRFAIKVGGALNKAFGGAGGLADKIDATAEWIGKNEALVGTLAKVAAGALVGKIAFNALRYAVVGVQSAVTMGRLAWARFAVALPAIGAALAPIALPLAAVGAALLVGGLVLRKYWEPASAWLSGVGAGFTEVLGRMGPLGDAFKLVGDAVGTVWTWFTKLLEPIKSSAAELDAAKNAGVRFGAALGAAFDFAFKPLTLLIGGIQWVIANVGAAIGKVRAMAGSGAPSLSGGYDAMGNSTGMPDLPAPAMASGRGTVNNTTQVVNNNSVVVNAKSDAKETAAEVDRLLKRQNAVNGRSLMYDGATP
ncbi:phage tail tape measure protein [Bradyrhizobium sp. AUGA SZCCT0160]|uniref:phage tail tape measure protein n=1 Tax=Bradyrhizobium sp. AUGA SZCCT0160 TaxID=2807662 RepID=UPI001BA96FA1|nr:phage tail tape measure protein [Bradyrhizobium sp. AUGA SZCCT0160]MBR1193965.1 phage tail tape measure protein [Bradyrhizobium sp. AUGA SZCCT0160]